MKPDSIWRLGTEPGHTYPTLSESIDADVAVIGAGITGLSTALHLARAGANVAVLEAEHVGFGASGRNGGQVIAGLKVDPDDFARHFPEVVKGPAERRRFADFVGGSARKVGEIVEAEGIDCGLYFGGWAQGAFSRRAAVQSHRRAEQWQALGAPVEWLDRAAAADWLGTDAYHGALLDRRSGGLDPLAYTRGLAAAAVRHGARLYEATAMTGLAHSGERHLVRAGTGEVSAEKVLIATDAYSGPGHRGPYRSFVNVTSLQIATAPLPPDLASAILPHGTVVSENRHLSFYYRLGPEERFMIGGRGTRDETPSARATGTLVRHASMLYPDLGAIPWELAWGGTVSITPTMLPALAELEGGLYAAYGYSGRGVALATLMGEIVSRVMSGEGEVPWPLRPMRPIPLHALRRPAVAAMVMLYAAMDRLGLGE
jgi:glycine/D-amino acid oxidase-like deaminating enzyme